MCHLVAADQNIGGDPGRGEQQAGRPPAPVNTATGWPAAWSAQITSPIPGYGPTIAPASSE